jgi:hypothetical protein
MIFWMNAPSNLTPDNFYTIADHAEGALQQFTRTRFIATAPAFPISSRMATVEAPTAHSPRTAQNSDLQQPVFAHPRRQYPTRDQLVERSI